MSNPFLAEIRVFAGSFAPKGWALCNGQLIPISQNTALFSLLATFYGGDGRINFALPNLQASAPMHFGQGPGLTPRDLGESGGEATHTLTISEVPQHSHSPSCTSGSGSSNSPGGNIWAATAAVGRGGGPPNYSNQGQLTKMNPNATSVVGGNQPHDNMSPFLGVTFIIALQGIYPQRP